MSHSINRPLLACAAALALAGAASAQTYTWNIFLDGPSEAPPNASPGTGAATITWNTATHMMNLNLAFSGLLGTTTASHIHAATTTPGTGTAGVATMTPSFSGFPLGVSSGSMNQTYDMSLASSYNPSYVTAQGGLANAEAALLAAMLNNRAYLNIHTTVVPGGEIRGFIPTPGAAAALGLGGLVAMRRRR
jgi:hypothetical protein